MLKRYNAKNGGFTLIELLVVISIIGLLSSIIFASLEKINSKARDTKRITEIKQIEQALTMYNLATDTYPVFTSSNANCLAANKNSWSASIGQLIPTYLPQIPNDPINTNEYCYVYAGPALLSSNISCGGLPRWQYQWSILFRLENPNTTFDTVTTSNPSLTQTTHCIHGPLK